MGLPLSGRSGRRARLLLLGGALLASAVAVVVAPTLALVGLAAVVAVALWDRLAVDRELRALATAVARDEPAAKLEVGDDAWGELCHALNRLRQQRSAQRQIEPLLPALPLARAARLADAGIPPEGLECEVAVLAIALPAGVQALRDGAAAALQQARRHEAMLDRDGDRLLLIFGALDAASPAASLRAAREAAHALHGALGASGRPRLALAAGHARAVVLPGLGLAVVGAPVEQALGLQRHAEQAQLLCNEDAYLGLRRIGVLPPQPAPPRLLHTNERPVYSIAL